MGWTFTARAAPRTSSQLQGVPLARHFLLRLLGAGVLTYPWGHSALHSRLTGSAFTRPTNATFVFTFVPVKIFSKFLLVSPLTCLVSKCLGVSQVVGPLLMLNLMPSHAAFKVPPHSSHGHCGVCVHPFLLCGRQVTCHPFPFLWRPQKTVGPAVGASLGQSQSGVY